MDDRQTIVNTVDGSDWSGAEPIKYYEADGKYYAEMYGLINGMNENLSSLTVTPYARTGAEEGVPHEYTSMRFGVGYGSILTHVLHPASCNARNAARRSSHEAAPGSILRR